MQLGLVPPSSADTLLMYAYAQKGVAKADIEIDLDEANERKSPKVTYKISLDTATYVKWKAAKAVKGDGLLGKAAKLALAKTGAPIGLEDRVKALAEAYLPKNYVVSVVVQ